MIQQFTLFTQVKWFIKFPFYILLCVLLTMMFHIHTLYSKLNIISFNGQKEILFRFLHRKKTAFSIFFLQQIDKFYFSGRFVQLKQTCINLYRLCPCFCLKVYE